MGDRRIVLVGYPDAELLDIACVTSTLALANRLHADPPYDVKVVAPGGRPVTCPPGLTLAVDGAIERCRGPLDTLVVSGGWGHRAAAEDPVLVAHVRRLARESRRVASACTGASVLAAAGLLDGRRATTHWIFADDLAAAHPAVTVDPAPIYVRDGAVSTAAGVTSALDLTLAFVEEDHGAELARRVARGLVTYLHRPGNQAQMSVHVAAPAPDHDLVRDTVRHVGARLGDDLSAHALAGRAGVSERHLSRLFAAEIGMSPGRYVRRTRAEAAAQLLTSTTLPMTGVASRCGFGTVEALRQAFVDRFGVTPSHYRTTQGDKAAADRVDIGNAVAGNAVPASSTAPDGRFAARS